MKHVLESCPLCGGDFHCKVNNITQCDCVKQEISRAVIAFLSEEFDRCLCMDCLRMVNRLDGEESLTRDAMDQSVKNRRPLA